MTYEYSDRAYIQAYTPKYKPEHKPLPRFAVDMRPARGHLAAWQHRESKAPNGLNKQDRAGHILIVGRAAHQYRKPHGDELTRCHNIWTAARGVMAALATGPKTRAGLLKSPWIDGIKSVSAVDAALENLMSAEYITYDGAVTLEYRVRQAAVAEGLFNETVRTKIEKAETLVAQYARDQNSPALKAKLCKAQGIDEVVAELLSQLRDARQGERCERSLRLEAQRQPVSDPVAADVQAGG